MAAIRFTNSLIYTRTFTGTYLISILTHLNGRTTYLAHGLNKLVNIIISSGAFVCVELSSHINRQLFDIDSFQ